MKQVKVERASDETGASWNGFWRTQWKSNGFIENHSKIHELFYSLKSGIFFVLHPKDRSGLVTVTVLRGCRTSTSECFEINLYGTLYWSTSHEEADALWLRQCNHLFNIILTPDKTCETGCLLSWPWSSWLCFVPLWDGLHDLWEFRNTQRHGKDMEAQESELTHQTILQVTELYNLHQVKPEDQKLFFSSLESHLDRPQHELCAWLSNHEEQIQTFSCCLW